MSIAKEFEDKRHFVDGLNEPLSAMREFASIEYAKNAILDEEFIRITNTIGEAFYINVTGCSEEAILLEVARMLLGKVAHGFVTDRNKKLKIAPMFRKAV